MVAATIIGVAAKVASSVIGAVVQGNKAAKETANSISIKVNEYRSAADQVRNAADEYSGKKAYEKIRNAGLENAALFGNNTDTAAGVQFANPGNVTNTNERALNNAVNTADNTKSNFESGYSQGQDLESSRLNSLYNADTVEAQQKMKQADIDYNVANQLTQNKNQALGQAINTAKDVLPVSTVTNKTREVVD